MSATATIPDLDDAFATAGQRRPVATLPHPEIANGVGTITFPCGTHKTLRLHTQQVGRMAGKRIISLLIGPDNSTDYQGIAELTPLDGPRGVHVWKAFKGKRTGEYAELFWELLGGAKLEDHELMISRNCLRCNRPLTRPDSLADNLGPECRKKEGGKRS